MKKISIEEIHKFKTAKEIFDENKSKEENAYFWIIEFRKFLLENNLAKTGDLFPSKKDISFFLNLSLGTVQNALRSAENEGYFISKQNMGTTISSPDIEKPQKMFSKKDKALIEIKRFLVSNNYLKGELLPTVSKLSEEINASVNTTRLAVLELIQRGVIIKEVHKRNVLLILNTDVKLSDKEKSGSNEIKSKSLSKVLKENVKKYISQNYKTGDKIPPNSFFAKHFNVSTRTIHLCMKELAAEKFIYPKRGSSGTIFTNKGDFEKSNVKEEKISLNYKWENGYKKIINYIIKNNEAGDKTLSIKEFSKKLNLGEGTVKRAVKELIKDGVLYSQKGKYGGLFVVEMPEKTENSYQWLIINPNYFKENML